MRLDFCTADNAERPHVAAYEVGDDGEMLETVAVFPIGKGGTAAAEARAAVFLQATAMVDGCLFVWDMGGVASYLVIAKDHEEAYRKAISCRLRQADWRPEDTEAERVERVRRWFRENDELTEVEACGFLGDEPYAGELPDDDSDGIPL